jgi:hypothetical protein
MYRARQSTETDETGCAVNCTPNTALAGVRSRTTGG